MNCYRVRLEGPGGSVWAPIIEANHPQDAGKRAVNVMKLPGLMVSSVKLLHASTAHNVGYLDRERFAAIRGAA